MADTLGPQIGPIPLKMFKNQLLDFFTIFCAKIETLKRFDRINLNFDMRYFQ